MITGYTDNRQTTDSDEIGDPTPGVSEEHLGCLQVDITAAPHAAERHQRMRNYNVCSR